MREQSHSASNLECIHEESECEANLPVIHELDGGLAAAPQERRHAVVHEVADALDDGHENPRRDDIPVPGLPQNGGQRVGGEEAEQQQEDLRREVPPHRVPSLQQLPPPHRDQPPQPRAAQPPHWLPWLSPRTPARAQRACDHHPPAPTSPAHPTQQQLDSHAMPMLVALNHMHPYPQTCRKQRISIEQLQTKD